MYFEKQIKYEEVRMPSSKWLKEENLEKPGESDGSSVC